MKALCINDEDDPTLVIGEVYDLHFITSMQVIRVEDYDGPAFQAKPGAPTFWASNFLFVSAAIHAVLACQEWKQHGITIGFARNAEEAVKVHGYEARRFVPAQCWKKP